MYIYEGHACHPLWPRLGRRRRVIDNRLTRGFDLASEASCFAMPAAALGPYAHPTIGTGFADDALVMFNVGHAPHGRCALAGHNHLPLGGHLHQAFVVVHLAQELSHGASGTADPAWAVRETLHAVDQCANGQ